METAIWETFSLKLPWVSSEGEVKKRCSQFRGDTGIQWSYSNVVAWKTINALQLLVGANKGDLSGSDFSLRSQAPRSFRKAESLQPHLSLYRLKSPASTVLAFKTGVAIKHSFTARTTLLGHSQVILH